MKKAHAFHSPLYKFCIFFLFLFIKNINAQIPDWVWARSGQVYSDGRSITADVNGYIYTVGEFWGTVTFGTQTANGANNYSNIFIVKHDKNGNAIWIKSAIPHGGGNCTSGGITTDVSGNIYITGYYDDSVSFDNITLPSHGASGSNFFIAKYDVNGNAVWAKTAESDFAYGISIAADKQTNVYVTGWFASVSGNRSIIFDSDTLINDTANNTTDIFIVKYDSSGNVIWAKSAGGNNMDYSWGIATDTTGNIFLTGNSDSQTIRFDTISQSGSIFLVKYDSSGNVHWAKNYQGAKGSSVVTDFKGNIYFTGSFGNPSISFDSITLICNGYYDVFITKCNPDGNVIWAKSAGGSSLDEGKGIAIDTAGNAYITGDFYSDSIAFGNNIILTNNPAINYDVFVAGYDTYGNVIWVKNATGNDDDEGLSLATNAGGDIYVTGIFGSDTLTLSTIALANSPALFPECFIAKLSAIPLVIDNVLANNTPLQIYPNPAHNKLTVVFNSSARAQNVVSLYDVMGRVVLEKTFEASGGENKLEVDVAGVAQGVYVLRVGGERVKVVVQ